MIEGRQEATAERFFFFNQAGVVKALKYEVMGVCVSVFLSSISNISLTSVATGSQRSFPGCG